jgi:hypothetical protein
MKYQSLEKKITDTRYFYFRYLGQLTINCIFTVGLKVQNLMSRLNSGSACYHVV